jgi:hypothetical protein
MTSGESTVMRERRVRPLERTLGPPLAYPSRFVRSLALWLPPRRTNREAECKGR